MVLPLDMPDNYPWLPGSGKSTLGDLGELASRLGSIVTYDRRGSVYWLDGFEDGLEKWKIDGAGSDYAARLVTNYVNSGSAAAKITGASDGSRQGWVQKSIAPALLSTYGLEVTFSFGGDIEYFFMYFLYYDGTNGIQFTLLINPTTQKIYIIDKDAGYTEIGTVPMADGYPELFNTTKMVVDMTTYDFVRVLFNHHSYDISDYAQATYASGSPPAIILRVGVQSDAGVNGIIYVDNVIVTVGDP